MLVNQFNPQQACLLQHRLSHVKSVQQGTEVWQISQNQHLYCIKFLNSSANLKMHQQHHNELDYYHQFQGEDFCLQAQQIESMQFLKHCNDIHLQKNLKSDFLVMPYVVGLQLDTQDQKHLSSTLQQILRCVGQLHQQGYIHGDLKLQHFLHYNQQLKIIDFAQLSLIDDPTNVQIQGGTPAYMAPELFLGQCKSVQSDIYALGILMYQILSGQKPFSANTYQAWAQQHCQQSIPLLPQYLQVYQPIIDKMLAKQLQHRFLNLKQVKGALDLINIT